MQTMDIASGICSMASQLLVFPYVTTCNTDNGYSLWNMLNGLAVVGVPICDNLQYRQWYSIWNMLNGLAVVGVPICDNVQCRQWI